MVYYFVSIFVIKILAKETATFISCQSLKVVSIFRYMGKTFLVLLVLAFLLDSLLVFRYRRVVCVEYVI